MTYVNRDILQIETVLHPDLNEELGFFPISCPQLNKIELLLPDIRKDSRSLLFEDFFFTVREVIILAEINL